MNWSGLLVSFLLEVWEYILVFIFAAIPWFEIALIIPLAIISGLNPVLVALVAFLGNLATVYLLVIFFEKFKAWREKKRKVDEPSKSKKGKRAYKIWNRYGLPGLSFLGPIVIGSHIAAFIGLILGANKKSTIIWQTMSLAVWTLIFVVVTYFGLDFLNIGKG